MNETREQMGPSVERLLRLQRVTSELSRALTPSEVASVIVLLAGPTLGAAECCIYLLEQPGVLRLVEMDGVPRVELDPWRTLLLDAPLPITEAGRTNEPVWVESLEALRRRYPVADGVPLSRRRAWACLPLGVPARVLGVLALGFEHEQGFTREDQDFACLVSKQCASAVERAHLYERERELREQAERARAEAEEHRRQLEQEHRRLKAVLQQLPQGVLLAEAPSGRILMANEQMERIHRRPVPPDWGPEQYTAFTGFHPDGRPYLPDEWPLVRALTRGEVVRGEVLDVLREDGSRLTLEVSAGPVRDAEGRVTAAVAVLEDISERLRLERAVHEGEAVFRRIMASDMMGLAFSGEEGLIQEANDAFLSLVGHDREEVRRGELCWRELVPPEGREAEERVLHELETHGVAATFEAELLRADGSRVPVLTGSARVEEQDRVLTFVMDLSDLKRAEGALRFLAMTGYILAQTLEVTDAILQHVACLASLSVASWCVIDLATPEGPLRRAAVAHHDPELEERLRRAWPVPSPRDAGSPPWEAMHSGEPLLFADFGAESWRHLSRGVVPAEAMEDWERCSVLMVPLRSRERVLGLITLGSCVPRRRHGPEDIAMGQELAHRVTATLERSQLFQDSQRAVRLRDEFLAVASHELKTPLTPLRLQLQGLRRVVETRAGQPVAPERVLRAVQGCEAQVRNLAGLVNDLLDVSRLAQGRLPLHLEEVDLVAVTRDVLEQFSSEATRAGCRVELAAGAPVVGLWDRLRLEQVVTNLLTNALKYGAGRPILLRVWSEEGRARLGVRDEGIGIAPEHRGRIFGKFERAVSERHYGGLGLGLHITRQIVQAFGGTIRVESELGQGSTFTVELPLGAEAARGAGLDGIR
ncbi:PAS domain S-box protein [Archangium violaceum]|uniref:sensor histidine kinase n=1 Tax=Archangium violaceum TaxID=83451 RepID=UPI00194F3257|nr:ATP-binding protein [Archangium violaceum]QRN97812.1 PAS domain S-box protein [Archangium violaceum]